ncbi:GTP cyclohydrolase II [Candidatus Woesearchaeota archaeon]|nr:GTP cyclohydrolase II [Candidatus Woesearchaeota archaeon]
MKDIIKETIESEIPTRYYGTFRIRGFRTKDNLHHVALVKGDVKAKEDVIVRIHSECLTGDVFHSLKCDCGEQLEAALKRIDKEGMGVLIYLRQEGRGIGLFNKIKAYELQEQGMDTVEANQKLGFKADQRDYTLGAAILKELGLSTIRLMTNNPKKIEGLEKYGIKIRERLPLVIKCNKYNEKYLCTKKTKLGHLIEEKGVIK